jgi:hypothetical protein
VCFRVLGKSRTDIRPYSLGAVAALTATGVWNTVLDAQAVLMLDPPQEQFIHHYFWGVSPAEARIYFQHPSRQDRWNLVQAQRVVAGDVGYVDGWMSPADGPYMDMTEFFTVQDLTPAFQLYNPTGAAIVNAVLTFEVARYTYHIIKDPAEIKDILLGKRQRRMYTFGGVDPNPPQAPQWLENAAGAGLMALGTKIMEEG